MKHRCIVVIIIVVVLINWPAGACAATLSLTSGGTPTVTGTVAGTPASTQSTIGNTLTATLVFGDVSTRNTNTKVKIVMPIRISTQTNYTVKVQRTVIAASSGVQAIDIGFGVGNFRAQGTGSKLTANAVSGITTNGTFATDPSTATINSDGQPQFQATLNNISTTVGTSIFSGPTTIASGGLGDDRNSVLADLTFVIVPQFYAPTASFTVTLTITIS